MKRTSLSIVLSGLIWVGTMSGAWVRADDPHTAHAGLPGADRWPAAVAGRPTPPAGDARAVAAFVGALPAPARRSLAVTAPGVVGNTDGVPPAVRYVANAAVLRAAGQLPPVEPAGLAGSADGDTTDAGTDRRSADVDGAATDRRRAAAARSNTDSPFTSVRAGNRTVPAGVLAYDPRGDGRIAVVLGDLATARNIAILVPGNSWQAGDILDGVARLATGRPVAQRTDPVHQASYVAAATGPDTAVIVWLGYDSPEGFSPQTIRSERAIDGGRALRTFVAGLPAGRHVTLLCHSYGGVVCGRAVRTAPPIADELVLVGSPGADADRATDLRGVRRVWAGRTGDDPISYVPSVRVLGLGHGTAPTSRGFGASTFRTTGAHGHAHYYRPGTESLANIARIVLGRSQEVTRDAG